MRVNASLVRRIVAVSKAAGAALLEQGRRIGWWKIGAAVFAVAAIGGGAHALLAPKEAAEAPQQSVRAVEVRSVAELSSQSVPLSVAGTVSSKSEAQVRPEGAGRVTALYYSLGDYVGAGAVVAELESASQRAALLQAQGAEDAAQANLDKVKKGTRSETLATLESAQRAARSGAVNALLAAYTAVDTAIAGTTDANFSGTIAIAPRFNFAVSNSSLRNTAENERLGLEALLARERQKSASLSDADDLDSELETTTQELRQVRDYLDDLVALLNVAIPTVEYPQTTVSAALAAASGARASVGGALASLSGAKQGLETARNSLSQGVTGAQPEDVAGAEAALKQAQGAVAAARANLEHAIIRSPISGTINSMSIERGEYVSPAAPVFTVANNGALEVVAYLSENDAREVAVGKRVSFDTGATGVVTKIAPAIDPMTKKIEIRIGVSDPRKTLVNGQSVLAGIERAVPQIASGARVTIPIAALKVEADRVSVFTVNASSTLTAHAVELGALQGDRVEIVSGLSAGMEIVTDARGLREGQQVEVR